MLMYVWLSQIFNTTFEGILVAYHLNNNDLSKLSLSEFNFVFIFEHKL